MSARPPASDLTPLSWLLPIPFYFLELLVGIVQALVFMLLTSVFTTLICEHDEEHGHEHQVDDDDGPVGAVDGIDQQLAETWPGKDRFRQHRSGKEVGNLGAQNGHHGNEGVAEGVTPYHHALGKPFGPGRADVVLAQYLQHTGPGEPGKKGCGPHTQGNDGKDEIAPVTVAVADTGNPIQVVGKCQQEQQPHPKNRGADA